MLSKRVRGIGLSPTLRISGLAGRLRAAGEDVLDFSAGQPDFPSPDNVKEAGAAAIRADRTGYTANAGLIELREAVARNYREKQGIEYETDAVLISPGAKASLYFACMTLLDPGDRVVIPAPYWVTYPEQVRLAGGEPVVVETDEASGFKLDPARLERAIDGRTKLLILNYPSNPTGASYSDDELRALAEVCLRRDVWIVADEIYSGLLFGGRRFRSLAALDPRFRERTVVIDGASKSYAMTGWRIGWTVGPAEVIAGMARLQSHVTSNATSISQWASVAALETAPAVLEARVREFERRRDRLVEGLRALDGVRCIRPVGAFYAFPAISGCFGRAADGRSIDGGESLAEYLLATAKIAVVPGEAFGAAEHVRFSYATSMENIDEGLRRLASALAAIERR